MIASLALVVALHTVAQDAPPQPPPTDKPPVVELAPTAPPPPVTTPVEPEPPAVAPTPSAPKATPKPDLKRPAEKVGMEPIPLGAVQMAAGTGACCVGCCVAVPFGFGLGLIPVVGSYLASGVTDVIIGTTIGATEGVVGDWLGGQRAPLLWPIVASSGILLVSSAGTTAIAFALNAQGVALPTDPNQLSDPTVLQRYTQQAGFLGVLSTAIGCGGIVGAIAVPAIVYGMTAVDKKPGDTGQGFPGLMEPANPEPAPTKAITVAMAMAY